MRVFWALRNGIEPIGECHLGPKKLEISKAQPPPTCPSNGYARKRNKSRGNPCFKVRAYNGPEKLYDRGKKM
jgi:hypothetical protein